MEKPVSFTPDEQEWIDFQRWFKHEPSETKRRARLVELLGTNNHARLRAAEYGRLNPLASPAASTVFSDEIMRAEVWSSARMKDFAFFGLGRGEI